jgi:hypothetical protein
MLAHAGRDRSANAWNVSACGSNAWTVAPGRSLPRSGIVSHCPVAVEQRVRRTEAGAGRRQDILTKQKSEEIGRRMRRENVDERAPPIRFSNWSRCFGREFAARLSQPVVYR